MTSKSPRKRPLISKWTIVFMLLTVPFILFYSKDVSTPEARLNQLLEEAQQVGGADWWVRTVLYEKLPRDFSAKIGLEYPGHPRSVQAQALQRLAEIPGEAPRKIPVLTNILATTSEPGIIVGACRTLGLLGTNASTTLPFLLSLNSRPASPYSQSAPLATASLVAPNDPVVRELIEDRIHEIIATNTVSGAPSKMRPGMSWEFIELQNLIYAFCRIEADSNSVHQVFTEATRADQPEVIGYLLTGFVNMAPRINSQFTGTLRSLVLKWQEIPSKEMRRRSFHAAMNGAIQVDKHNHLALELYCDAWIDSLLKPLALQRYYRRLTQDGEASVAAEATRHTVDQLLQISSNDEWDTGSWMGFLQREEITRENELDQWLFTRAADRTNPNQIWDWGRYVEHFGQIEMSIGVAVQILEMGENNEREQLLERICQQNPGERSEWDDTFLERYGLNHLKTASGDILRRRFEEIPTTKAIPLIVELMGSIDSANVYKYSKSSSLKRLRELKTGIETDAKIIN